MCGEVCLSYMCVLHVHVLLNRVGTCVVRCMYRGYRGYIKFYVHV